MRNKGKCPSSFQLDTEEGQFLVRIARKSVERYLREKRVLDTSSKKIFDNTTRKLWEPCGVFVTINSLVNGEKKLRGCIGYPYPSTPLIQAVIDSAINAATRDPRFMPISLDELDSIVFEVSVLTPPQLLKAVEPSEYPSKLKIGQHGLIVERNAFKGLLLPQVPVEWGWDEEEFLCQCCIKAGLPPDCWVLKDTKVYAFEALIFEEETPRGRVRVRAFNRKQNV